jgi:hypothetical protein
MSAPIRLGDGGWERSDARHVVEQALRFEERVDPTAEDRVWTRIESRRARGVRLVWSMFAAGAACAVVASILVLKLARRDSTVLPFVVAADGSQKALRLHEPLPPSDATTLVDLHGAGRMVADADSEMVFDEFAARAVSLRVDRGSVLLHVAPRPNDAPFVIRTPGFTAKVVGTVLHVTVRDGRSAIAVGHGRVEVQPVSGPPVIVATGQRWPADAREVPRPELFERLGASDLEGTAPAAFAPRTEPAHEKAKSCGGAPDEAMRCYLELATTGDSTRAESALYEAGWIALRDLREPKRALEIWTVERTRFPSGLLADEAQTSSIDALVALDRTQRARGEIDAYLHHHPHGLRAAEMHFVKGTLLVQADHNCRRAMGELTIALRHPAPPWDARARAALDRCQHASAR